MHHPDKTHDGATYEALDFHPFERPAEPPTLPNFSSMGVVTLADDATGARDDRTFISSRVLTQEELAVEWAAHRARHPDVYYNDIGDLQAPGMGL